MKILSDIDIYTMPRWAYLWYAMSFAITIAQIYLGTDTEFFVMSAIIFLLFPITYGLYVKINSFGAYIVAATYMKLFFVAQVVKVILGQPADSYLAAPTDTALVLLLSLVAFLAVALVMSAMELHRRPPLIQPLNDPVFMGNLGWATLVLVVVSMALRHLLGVDAEVRAEDVPEGGAIPGAAIWNYMRSLPPFSVAVFTARQMLLSSGRNTVDFQVLIAILFGIALGLLSISRTEMLTGVVAWALTYFCYGGRLRPWQLAAGIVSVLLMTFIIFPLINIQRGLQPGLSTAEYISETFDIAEQLASGATPDDVAGTYDLYSIPIERQYYGTPTGLWDRFTPNQVDEVVDYVEKNGASDWTGLLEPAERLVPNFVYRALGLDTPVNVTFAIQTTLNPYMYYSAPNYGVMSEGYFYAGHAGVVIMIMIFFTLYLSGIQYVVGSWANNYILSFYTSTVLFSAADESFGSIVGLTLGQGIVCLAIYALAWALWARR